jgi:hypothetical protein
MGEARRLAAAQSIDCYAASHSPVCPKQGDVGIIHVATLSNAVRYAPSRSSRQ